MAGWTILDRLKHEPATRHIPVHVITGDENRRRGLALGAMTYLEKAVTKDNLNAAFDTIHGSLQPRARKLLIVTQEDARRTNWQETLGGNGVEVVAVASGGESLAVVRHQYLDAIVLDLRLADIPALQLLEEIQAEVSPALPAVIAGPRSIAAETEAEIRRIARQRVVRYADSPERLL